MFNNFPYYHIIYALHYCNFRITPTRAGNTLSTHHFSILIKDHPRSRGEYNSPVSESLLISGSPPLTRGILTDDISLIMNMGITPAHAGNTKCTFHKFTWNWDHPRSRGEYLRKVLIFLSS